MKCLLLFLMMLVLMSTTVMAYGGSSVQRTKNGMPDYGKPVVLTNTGKTSIQVKWKRVKNAKDYEIYRADEHHTKFKKIKTIKSGKTVKYTNKKLRANTFYLCRQKGVIR